MKTILVCTVLVISTLAEPPVDNRYLPPSQALTALSPTYGAPGFGQRQTDAVFGGRPSSTYGAPARSRRPNSQYGAPSQSLSLSNQYIPPRSSNQYQAPISQYQAPNAQYQAPVNQYQAPSAQYGLPEQAQFGQISAGRQLNAPSQEYGAPGFGRAAGGNHGYSGEFGQSRQYLPPNARGGYDDGSNGEPANYNFEYMVKDDASGNDFGHRESRQGDRAEGLYYVLLPDGRKQTVEYEADQNGFKPRISYEDTGIVAGGGYDRNSQSRLGGQYPGASY